MRSGRWFLGVVALLAAARAGADNPAPSPSPVPALPTPPPLVAVNPPAPAPQAARGPEALRLFGRLDDDRSAVYIASGPPDARVTVRCPDSLRTLEIWTYLEHPTLGKNARILFYPESPTGSYRYWTVLEGEPVLLAPSAKGTLAALEARSAEPVPTRSSSSRRSRTSRGARATTTAASPSAGPSPCRTSSLRPARSRRRRRPSSSRTSRSRGRSARSSRTTCPRSTASSSRTSSRSSRTSSATRCSSSARTTSASISSTTSGSAARWRRTASASLSATSTRCGSSRPRSASGTSNTDQGRIFLVNGPPDGIRKIDCQDVYWPLQIWYYERLESLRLSKVLLLFYQPFGAGDYRLWTPLDGPQAIVAGGASGHDRGRRLRGASTSAAARSRGTCRPRSARSRPRSGRRAR